MQPSNKQVCFLLSHGSPLISHIPAELPRPGNGSAWLLTMSLCNLSKRFPPCAKSMTMRHSSSVQKASCKFTLVIQSLSAITILEVVSGALNWPLLKTVTPLVNEEMRKSKGNFKKKKIYIYNNKTCENIFFQSDGLKSSCNVWMVEFSHYSNLLSQGGKLTLRLFHEAGANHLRSFGASLLHRQTRDPGCQAFTAYSCWVFTRMHLSYFFQETKRLLMSCVFDEAQKPKLHTGKQCLAHQHPVSC